LARPDLEVTQMRNKLITIAGAAVALIALLPLTGAARSTGNGEHPTLRWDLVHIDFTTTPMTLSAGGHDSASAADSSRITLTGSGTFEANTRDADDVTGGGTWTTTDLTGASTGSGTYRVTSFVSWEGAPGTANLNDLIAPVSTGRAGLAVLKVRYSDGSSGDLIISCHFGNAPNSIFEGTRATKGFVGYVFGTQPIPGVDADRTVFHQLHED
jgi:hypothetical protein